MAKKPTNISSVGRVVPVGQIEQRIVLIRGHRVILASDLALMYGVPVNQLNQAVKRNTRRFPDDFVFQLTKEEAESAANSPLVILNQSENLKSQFVTSSWGGARRALPYAFTEHGVIMAANVLRSGQAVTISVYVVRAFVKLRELLSNHRELAVKLGELERKLQAHDKQITSLFDAIRSLMTPPPEQPKPRIGFKTEEKTPKKESC